MGHRLRKLPLRIKGLGGGKGMRKKIDSNVQKKDGKVIKSKQIAKSRLTDALIDRLHNYFEITLRSNAKAELKPERKQALLACFMSHQVKGKTTTHSWCQYHRDYINQNLYRPGPGTANVIKEIKTIYQDLTKDNDLVPAWHYTKRE